MENEALTLVLGASPNPQRASYAAIERLVRRQLPVYAVGIREGRIAGQAIHREIPADLSVDTVTLYLSAQRQEPYEQALLDLQPRRIIFNPGAENPVFAARAAERQIETENACTLVLLATGTY